MELTSFFMDYSVQIAVVVGIGFLYYKFGGGFGRKSRENYSILVGDKPPNATKLIRNYRCEKNGLVVGYHGCETIYQTFQYVIHLVFFLSYVVVFMILETPAKRTLISDAWGRDR